MGNASILVDTDFVHVRAKFTYRGEGQLIVPIEEQLAAIVIAVDVNDIYAEW